MKPNRNHRGRLFPLLACATALCVPHARASIAYGSINNFDTVNDTGHECHGFEIEIEDCHSTDITYTYTYNHYGVPRITEDHSVPAHPRCLIRWESKRNPDGSWASYTAIPSDPIDPTNGHQFTNPGVNFGGEHFGVGFRAAVGTVRYQWLVDDGAGNLVHGGMVQVATPTFTYFPPAAGAPAQVQAVIEPPEPPEIPVKEFGPAVWVKEIRTTSHNNREVELRDLVSDDPDDPDDVNWRNGEPDEIEVEWQILQKELTKPDGGNNGRLEAAPEDLDNGDEVVTRRYEFFEYVGPFDDETGEAMADNVGSDDLHGDGIKEINGVETDLSTVVVVGEYKGAQMAAVDVGGGVGLIEHVSEGEVGADYTPRRLVVAGPLPFTATRDGDLPAGMDFDEVTGILSGTPEESGEFAFSVTAGDGAGPEVSRNYTLRVAAAGEGLPPAALVDTAVFPAGAGSATGDGAFDPGTSVTVTATPAPGFRFAGWSENGTIVSYDASHIFVIEVNRSLVANFVEALPDGLIHIGPAAGPGGLLTIDWPTDPPGLILEESPDLSPGSWTESTRPVTTAGGNHHVSVSAAEANQRFFRLRQP